MTRHIILRALAKLLIPFIMLFALYVQFHGDYGPGGGFQAGVIFASGIVLIGVGVALKQAKRVRLNALSHHGRVRLPLVVHKEGLGRLPQRSRKTL